MKAEHVALVATLPLAAVLAVVAALGGGIGFGVGAFAVAGAGALVSGLLRAEALRKAFEALAQAHGWTFVPLDARDLPRRFHGFRPFGTGGSRTAHDVLAGDLDGMPFEAFTYTYVVGSGKDQRTERFRVAAVQMPLDGPDLRVSPETVGHKLWDALGGADIDFESDAFSRRFWVKSDDRRFAYDVLPPATMEWMLENSGPWSWQWRGPTLVLTSPGVLGPDEVVPLLQLAKGFRDLLPRHLLAQRRP